MRCPRCPPCPRCPRCPCTLVVARWCLHAGGCTLVAARWCFGWWPCPRCPCTLVVARGLLHTGGCTLVVARWWLHAGACTLVLARWCARGLLHTSGCTLVVARWWLDARAQRIRPPENNQAKVRSESDRLNTIKLIFLGIFPKKSKKPWFCGFFYENIAKYGNFNYTGTRRIQRTSKRGLGLPCIRTPLAWRVRGSHALRTPRSFARKPCRLLSRRGFATLRFKVHALVQLT